MSRDGSGTYTAPASSFNPAVADTEISETDWNTLLDDIETALTASIAKDGQTTTTARIPFASGVLVNNTGLNIQDTDASHELTLKPGSNLSADRTLTITTGDADRTLTIEGNATLPYGQGVLQNYISGLTLSAAGSTATFGIATGQAADGTNARYLALASAYTKTTSAWAVGTGNGGLDTGAIANSTWYHVWLIQRSDTGVVDVLVSTSATAPTMPTSYDYKRRIGAMKTDGSAQWVAFTQVEDHFDWAVEKQDATASDISGTTAFDKVLASVPTGVRVVAKLNGWFRSSAAGNYFLVSDPTLNQTNNTPTGNITAASESNNGVSAFNVEVRTDTAAKVQIHSSDAAPTSFYIITRGWIDPRGKY